MKALLTLLITLCSLNLLAQTGEEQLTKQFRQSDKELTKVYNKFMAKLRNSKDRTTLIESQTAWLKYRDANCKFISRVESEGGIVSNKMKIDCMIQTTKDRISALKELLSEF